MKLIVQNFSKDGSNRSDEITYETDINQIWSLASDCVNKDLAEVYRKSFEGRISEIQRLGRIVSVRLDFYGRLLTDDSFREDFVSVLGEENLIERIELATINSVQKIDDFNSFIRISTRRFPKYVLQREGRHLKLSVSLSDNPSPEFEDIVYGIIPQVLKPYLASKRNIFGVNDNTLISHLD